MIKTLNFVEARIGEPVCCNELNKNRKRETRPSKNYYPHNWRKKRNFQRKCSREKFEESQKLINNSS